MLTVVKFQPSNRVRSDAAGLLADYTAFDRARAAQRPYMTAFAGFAALIFAGALIGRLPVGEAEVAGGLCLLPAAILGGRELWLRQRLARRLNRVRADVRTRKS
jgi:hypothetical protein